VPRTPSPETTAAAARLDVLDGPESVGAIAARIAERGGRIRTIATIRPLETDPPQSELEIEVDGLTPDELLDALDDLPDIQAIRGPGPSAASSASG
jgi:predicted regulator of amino acid metabolism with ACT domain